MTTLKISRINRRTTEVTAVVNKTTEAPVVNKTTEAAALVNETTQAAALIANKELIKYAIGMYSSLFLLFVYVLCFYVSYMCI